LLSVLSYDSSFVIVYEKNNKILGYATGKYFIGKSTNDTINSELFGLYVNPNEQNAGIGSLLFQEIKPKFISLKKHR